MYSTALERCENNDRQDTYGGAPVTQNLITNRFIIL